MAISAAFLLFVATSCVCGSQSKPFASTLNWNGYAESVGMLSGPLKQLETNITAYLTPANYGSASFNEIHPLYPGATVIVGHENTVVSYFAVGETLKYANVNGTELPEDQQIKTAKDTIYDMASLTKMFTTIVALQQIERGAIDLNATVATYVPEFAINGKEDITILMLMTHTSGFDADPKPDLWSGYTNYDDRKNAIIEQRIINAPGTIYLYSDLNYMNLQFVLEAVTNTTLDNLIHDDFTAPLGMTDTYYNRGDLEGPNGVKHFSRVATTEFQIDVLGPTEPDRPQPIRATVHDENAWSLNGVSGHAGLFSTARDLAIFCQMILNNGTYNGTRILKPSTVDLIFHDFNTAFPGNAHGPRSILLVRRDAKFADGRTHRLHRSNNGY